MEAALTELFSPSTPAPRRRELQAQIIAERARPAAWASYREALLQDGSSEALLWFVLSLCEAALTLHWPLPPAERQQLKADLTGMLLGPAAQQERLPPSARGKALQCLAVLARWEWPAEDAAALSNVLQLLAAPGAPRLVGARLLRAIADEFDPRSHRSTWKAAEQLQVRVRVRVRVRVSPLTTRVVRLRNTVPYEPPGCRRPSASRCPTSGPRSSRRSPTGRVEVAAAARGARTARGSCAW